MSESVQWHKAASCIFRKPEFFMKFRGPKARPACKWTCKWYPFCGTHVFEAESGSGPVVGMNAWSPPVKPLW